MFWWGRWWGGGASPRQEETPKKRTAERSKDGDREGLVVRGLSEADTSSDENRELGARERDTQGRSKFQASIAPRLGLSRTSTSLLGEPVRPTDPQQLEPS